MTQTIHKFTLGYDETGKPFIIEPTVEKVKNYDRDGFVYLLSVDNGRIFKIGKTVNLEGRLKRHKRRYKNFDVKYLGAFQSEAYGKAEAYWQNRFKDSHFTGEWFLLNNNQVDLFLEECRV